MSDRIAVMMEGEILQCDAPDVIYEDPQDIRVAEFIGSPKINILPAEARDGALSLFGRKLCAVPQTQPALLQLGLRPQALRLTGADPLLTGQVAHVENLGSELFAQIALDADAGRVTVRASSADRQALQLGARVGLNFALPDALLFDAQGKRAPDPAPAALRQSEVA